MSEKISDLLVLEEGQSTEALMSCTCSTAVIKIK